LSTYLKRREPAASAVEFAVKDLGPEAMTTCP